ncbi:MAG: hypothetical protein Kow0010_18190 [Dehalococcoidia bacterium]
MTTSPSAHLAHAVGPERPGGQGLDHHQEESGNLAIWKLLASEDGQAWTDFVATYRRERDGTGAYEAWSRRGMVRWIRTYAPAGGYVYHVLDVAGENPLERQDPRALATYEDELRAGRDPSDPTRAFIEPERLTYPFAYERISQLFDSPNAPDLIVNPKSYAYGRQPGQHGALDVVQSRAPLVFAGPGVRRGVTVDAVARHVDIAPTAAHLLGFPLIDGKDITGRTSSERGVPPDVYFRRQDGAVIEDILDGTGAWPERLYIFLLDGFSQTALLRLLDEEPGVVPNLARLVASGAMLRYGSITNFPSITWPSHNTIGTACWGGHHDIVNPTYYLRDRRETVTPQGQQFDTARFLAPGVETIFEAAHRVFGAWDGVRGVLTASINEPCCRGAGHASLERRLVGDRDELRRLTAETEDEISPRWAAELREFGHHISGLVDNRGLAQARQLILDTSHPIPAIVYHELSLPDSAAHDYGPHHEGAREAYIETDRRIGHVLHALEARGALDTTLFVVTSDHGMAAQDVSLRANPARIPERDGMAATTCEPCIYLHDLAVDIEVAHDGRTAHLTVYANDPGPGGEPVPVDSAEILVTDHRDGVVARARTDGEGVAGVAIPAELSPGELRATIHAKGYNPRHVRLDGTNLALDLRATLYGA